MNRLTTLIITAAILGICSVLVGQIFSISILNFIGIIFLSDAGILIGVEAIRKQIFFEKSRYNRKETETYIGFAAIIRGILVILLGLFLSTISVLVYFDIGQPIFLYFVRRPGILLIICGFYFLLTALGTILGYAEQRQGPKWNVFLELIAGRMLPGIILLVIALITIGFGAVEIAAPEYFDMLGGGLLELLFRPN